MNKLKFLMFTLIAVFTLGFCFNVNAEEVTTVSTLEEFEAAIASGGSIKLEDDITLTNQYTIIADLNIDLNGNTLITNYGPVRAIINRATLNIINGSLENINSSAYGIIDNYGELTVDNVTINDAGCGDGSSIKNRGYELTINNSSFNNTCVTKGNAGVYSDGILDLSNSTFESVSTGAYPLSVSSGIAVINNVNVTGAKGGMGVNSGKVTINGGTYNGGTYYGLWITNDGATTDVTVNSGTFIGELYGLRASVDDGKQDASDARIVINGGTFIGNTKAAAALTASSSERTWGLNIKGGTFSTDVSEYVEDGYSIKELSDGTFKVFKTLNKITVKDANITLNNGKTYQITTSGDPSDIETGYIYKSSNTKVATVSNTGKVKAVANGTATITVTSTYDTSKSATVTVKVETNLNSCKISGIIDKWYLGTARHQDVVVKCGNVTLTKGTDYKVSYKNNVDIGTASVIIKAKGEYVGTVTKTFKIVPVKIGYKYAIGKHKKMKIAYYAPAGDVKYQIAYKVKGTKKWKYVTTSKNKKTIKKLKANKTYKVKFRGYKVVKGVTYYGTWSDTKSVRVW